MILQSSCHRTISCLFFRSVVTCLNWKCFLILHLQSWSWLIIIWLELFNFQSNTESSDSNSNTAMVIDDLTQVITTIILLQTKRRERENQSYRRDGHQYVMGFVSCSCQRKTHTRSILINKGTKLLWLRLSSLFALLLYKAVSGSWGWSAWITQHTDHNRERRDHNKYCHNNIMWHWH